MNTDKENILIVDDAFTNRALLRKVFQDIYNVIEAENGVDALDIIRNNNNISAILLDIVMPELDGYGVLKKMNAEPELSGIPVIVVTSYDDYDGQIKALDLGAVDVVAKPFNARMLQLRVRNILERKSAKLISKENELIKLRLAQKDELLHLAEKDDRTGLNNKKTFCRITTEIIKQNKDQKYVIVYWDIDGFKVYNELFGPLEGDRLLKSIGERLCAISNIYVSHFQADHFVCCIPYEQLDTNLIVEQSADWLKKFNPEFNFITRIGVYIIDDPSVTVSLMCDRALLALRSIKGNYAQRVAFYDEVMRLNLLNEQEIIGQMSFALRNKQFHVYLQPQYNHADGSMVGAEALVRWISPEKGFISPGMFISIFEKNGFISQLDEYIWESVCRLIRKWLDQGLNPVPISVNISRVDLHNPKLCEILTGLINKYRLNPNMLRLEITESAYMEKPEQIIEIVSRLRDFGFYIEMDDFGSGYSSLNSLKDVPVDMLKLDIKFLSADTANSTSNIILSSIVRMALWLGKSVIAEGVETLKQADFLKSIGCLLIQGYLYAKPMPVESFEELMKNSTIVIEPENNTINHILGKNSIWDLKNNNDFEYNSLIGAVGIFEYYKGVIEAVRLNDKFVKMVDAAAFNDNFQNLSNIIHKDDRVRFLGQIQNAIDNNSELECETRWYSKLGSRGYIWLKIKLRVVANTNVRTLLYVAVSDITEQKEKQIELENKYKLLQSVYDTIPVGIIRYIYDGQSIEILSCNNEILRMLKCSDNVQLSKLINTKSNNIANILEYTAEAEKSSNNVTYKCSFTCDDGENLIVQAALQKVLNSLNTFQLVIYSVT